MHLVELFHVTTKLWNATTDTEFMTQMRSVFTIKLLYLDKWNIHDAWNLDKWTSRKSTQNWKAKQKTTKAIFCRWLDWLQYLNNTTNLVAHLLSYCLCKKKCSSQPHSTTCNAKKMQNRSTTKCKQVESLTSVMRMAGKLLSGFGKRHAGAADTTWQFCWGKRTFLALHWPVVGLQSNSRSNCHQ